ncbi:MAG: response regulator [Candidatus Scalindua sp.]|jgi:CheY-like chemotaxis protein|nr:response regulator [Candidatus Scalindua sp.]MBT5306254.1 response regulator [Candidatus Scalindua sp.]MBT6228869.1 response regulator [Candidatus Scalindua sp.]MBT6563141.1 response regulator [Candidatus Scalindua sp.]MBT7209807.1 response regulator [Candidatus Scalindua sp.]
MKEIMIVDNEQAFHDFYSEMLKDTDYEVISAYDCYEALAKLRENQPDLMIIDDLIFMDIVLNITRAGDTHLKSIKSRSQYDYVPFMKTSDLILQPYKNVKDITLEHVFPDVTFTREKIMEEINARIGDKVKLLI